MFPIKVPAIGVYGLNKQDSDIVLDVGWAVDATNLIFNETGVLESRKGTKKTTTTGYASNPKGLHEFSNALYFASGTKIYKQVGSTVTDVTGTTTPTSDDWSFYTFNNYVIGYQAGHQPIYLDTAVGYFKPATGTQHQSGVATSAYGRIWTVYGDDLYYSDLLINDFSGGSSGSFSLAEYWANGYDTATAIIAWNNHLIVFGERSVIVYANPDDPTNTMVITDQFDNMGCKHPRTIEEVGNDLFFLSNNGLKSFGRMIQEKSLPYRDLSRNINRYLINLVKNETGRITSEFSETESLYLISFEDSGKTIAFDVSTPLQDGSYRCTEWDISISDAIETYDKRLLLSTNSFLQEYTGYLDNVELSGTGGDTYNVVYNGVWNDFGDQVSANVKIPKNLHLFVDGTNSTPITITYSYDYSTSSGKTVTKTITDEVIKTPMTGSGQVMKVGFSFEVNNVATALKSYTLLTQVGRYS